MLLLIVNMRNLPRHIVTFIDLYMYFDAEDTQSPINHFATTLSPYPQDAFGKFPVDGIRGNVILGKYSANFYVDPFMEIDFKFFITEFIYLHYVIHIAFAEINITTIFLVEVCINNYFIG